MAQYDIILNQNIALSGAEFTEIAVSGIRGGIITFNGATATPSTLTPGNIGYVLTSAGAGADLVWSALPVNHTQGSDIGTTNSTFTVDSDSTTGKIIVSVTQNAAENHSMTITNAAMADDVVITLPATSGTVALTSQLHTQNTDTGTTSTTFAIDSDAGVAGVIIKANAGALEIRDSTDTNYASLVVQDLTVQGTTTTINSVTVTVDDKNIELGSVGTPSDTTADGGGITLKGTTDKTIIWDNTNDNWTLNQNVNIPTSNVYKINNVSVLSSAAVLGITATAGANTFALSVGTASLDIAAAAVLNIDKSLTVQTGNVTLTGNSAGSTLVLPSGSTTLGTMASANTVDYITKALYDANTILYATTDNTPTALTVAASTFVGRQSTGNIAAMNATQALALLWASSAAIGTPPATKTSTGVQGQIAFDSNYFYLCTATNTWKRTILSTNWV